MFVDASVSRKTRHLSSSRVYSSTMSEVTPLRCTKCNALVALGDGDTTRCPHCETDVAVPPALAALRTAERDEKQDRARATELYAQYSKPTSIFIRMWSVIGVI